MSDRTRSGETPALRARYRLRLQRKRFLWRALRSRHSLHCVADRTAQIRKGQLLAFTVLRNEAVRLKYFLHHYRKLGVDHFLVVDNGSQDGAAEWLAEAPDVSLWRTQAGYRDARFGLDWSGWLQIRYGHGHWCLTVDADEVLIYPHWDSRDLRALTARLDATGQPALGALMLDMYPRGRLGDAAYRAGEDPFETLCWFDDGPWRVQRQAPAQNLWVQGGVRERVFFADRPELSPTLNKLPLVKWNRRYAYRNSTHSILPPRLNLAYDGPGGAALSGVLLHSKFLDLVVARSADEKARGAHFNRPELFEAYYDRLSANPRLWSEASLRYTGWAQLEALGLMARGGWG